MNYVSITYQGIFTYDYVYVIGINKYFALEPALGRPVEAHSDQRELWVGGKYFLEPDLGRLTP